MLEKNSSSVSWVLIFLCVSLTLPEVFNTYLFSYDAALFVANGPFFMSMIADFSSFVSEPYNWVMEYYSQYPALAIRRHPPLFGLLEALLFSGLGISAIVAKCLVGVFYILLLRMLYITVTRQSNHWAGLFAVVFFGTMPMTYALASSVRLDIPALALLFLGYNVFISIQESSSNPSRMRVAVLAILLSASLYTYQLSLFAVAIISLSFMFTPRIDWRRKVLFVIMMIIISLPLVAVTFFFASDNIQGFFGQGDSAYKQFVPFESKWSFENWFYYGRILIKNYPIPGLGFLFWLFTKRGRKINEKEWFWLAWLLLTYVGFSLLAGKNVRYAFYLTPPLIILCCFAISDSIEKLRERMPKSLYHRIVIVCILGAGVFFNILTLQSREYNRAAGVEQIARNLVKGVEVKILYSGRFESQFILYTRKYDNHRNVTVLRYGHEFPSGKSLDQVVDSGIDVIVFETENLRNDIDSINHTTFLASVDAVLLESSLIDSVEHYTVSWGKPGQERNVEIKCLFIAKEETTN